VYNDIILKLTGKSAGRLELTKLEVKNLRFVVGFNHAINTSC